MPRRSRCHIQSFQDWSFARFLARRCLLLRLHHAEGRRVAEDMLAVPHLLSLYLAIPGIAAITTHTFHARTCSRRRRRFHGAISRWLRLRRTAILALSAICAGSILSSSRIFERHADFDKASPAYDIRLGVDSHAADRDRPHFHHRRLIFGQVKEISCAGSG